MSISAVILSFNSRHDIERCVRSLVEVEKLDAQRDQVLVVDNGSIDGSQAVIQELSSAFPGLVEGIYLPVNRGTTVSRNQAFARATGDHILVIDADIRFERPALDHLLACLAADRSIGIVAPRLVFPDGRAQLSTDVFPTLPRKIERLFRLRTLERREAVAGTAPRAVDYAISAFWLMRRDLLARIGPLDERIFYAPEDVDYCLRTWLGGGKVVCVPEVAVIHDAKERSRSLKDCRFALRHGLGLGYFFAKHRYLWRTHGLYRRIGSHHVRHGAVFPPVVTKPEPAKG